jgi:hypothetical protein
MARCNGPRAFREPSESLPRRLRDVAAQTPRLSRPSPSPRGRGTGRGTGRGPWAQSRVETYLPSPSPLGQAAPRQSSRGERRRPERRARRRRARRCGSWLRRGAVSPPHCLSGGEQPTHVSPPRQARARLLAGRGVRRSDRPLDEAVRVRLHGAIRADLVNGPFSGPCGEMCLSRCDDENTVCERFGHNRGCVCVVAPRATGATGRRRSRARPSRPISEMREDGYKQGLRPTLDVNLEQ